MSREMVLAEDSYERARDSVDLRVPVCSVMDTHVIKALIAGERDPREPATLVRGRMKPKIPHLAVRHAARCAC
jgi:hypothetical protein